MPTEEDLPKKEDSKATPKGSKSTLLVIMMGLLVMIVTPLATWFVVQTVLAEKPSDEVAQSRNRTPAAPATLFAIDPLVVNISETRMTRILRMQVHLVLSETRLEPVLREMMPIVKDRIMATAGRRTLSELESENDRAALKRDIALTINELVRDRMAGTVLDVAFSEFLIQ